MRKNAPETTKEQEKITISESNQQHSEIDVVEEFAEIINTAIEVTVDRIGTEFHALSGLAKDLASAGVFLSIVIACVLWAGVFYSHI